MLRNAIVVFSQTPLACANDLQVKIFASFSKQNIDQTFIAPFAK
jgi:hypothetical protein